MSFIRRLCLFGILTVFVITALGANAAHIGYLYPAGAQRGTTVYITAGGQYLKGASEVYISGEGVSGKVVQYYPSTERLKKEQRVHIQNRIREAQEKLWAKYPEQERPPKFQTKTKKRLAAAKLKREKAQKQKNQVKDKIPAEDPDDTGQLVMSQSACGLPVDGQTREQWFQTAHDFLVQSFVELTSEAAHGMWGRDDV